MSEMVNIGQIVLNAGTQMRRYTSDTAVEEYAALMKEGTAFEPVELYRIEDGRLILVNGFHRVAAAKKAALEQISATITDGTLQQAIWAAVAANKTNAVRRNAYDIRNAIETALLHPKGAEMSDRQIAEYIGCTHPTVGSVRAKLVTTGKITSATERKGKDGRVINTEKIGLRDQMANWNGLIFKPWMKGFTGDIRLIKQGDEYLSIVTDYKGKGSVVSEKYHLEHTYFSVRGGESGYGVIVDDAYVRLFEAHGMKVEIVDFNDLPKPMQSIAKAAFNSKDYYRLKRRKYVPVPEDLKPGDLAAKRTGMITKGDIGVIGHVVGRADSFIHVRHAGDKSDVIWHGEELCPLDHARKGNRGITMLTHEQRTVRLDSWIDRHWEYRALYAPEGIFLTRSFAAAVALGYDARLLSTLPGAIFVEDPTVGDVCVIFDLQPVTTLDVPVWSIEIGETEFDQAWRKWAASGRTAVSPIQPVEAHTQPSQPGEMVSAAGITHNLFNALRAFKSHLLDEIDSDDHELAEAYEPAVQLLSICAYALGIELDDDFEVM